MKKPKKAMQKTSDSSNTMQRIFKLPRFTFRPRIAYIFTLLIGFTFMFRYYQTTYQINLAEKTIYQNHFLSFNSIRLSGDYRNKFGTDQMSNLQLPLKIKTAQDRLLKTLPQKNTPKGQLLLSHTYIIAKEWSKADSILNSIDDKSADVLNDIGYIFYKQSEWSRAEHYFQRALEKQPQFPQALFNLAFAYDKQNKKEKAIIVLQEYLQYEQDENWLKAAQTKLDNIQTE